VQGASKLVLWVSPNARLRTDTADLEKWIKKEMAQS